MQKRVNQKGFTLVELVVVIAVLAILAGVGVVAYNGYIDYANKGADKKTVGELMRAIEMADYYNSGIIPEGGTATVYLTSNGVSAFVNGDVDNSANLVAGLEDAYGEGGLKNVSLRYQKWDGSIDAEELSKLMANISTYMSSNINSAMGQYLSLSGDSVASFAGDIESYWGAVESYVNFARNLDPDGELYHNELLSTVINFCSGEHGQDIIEYYGNGKTDRTQYKEIVEGVESSHEGLLASRLASNYAFASWVKNNHYGELTDSMKTELADLTKVQKMFDSYTTMGEEWDSLIAEYSSSGQAKVDMLAFVGMMEAASTLEPADGTLKDDEYTPLASKVVSSAAGILNRSTSLAQLKGLADSLLEAGGSSVISISATKSNGTLSITTFPKEANPRNDVSNISNAGPTTCERSTHHTSITIVGNVPNNTLKITYNVSNNDLEKIEICGILDEYKTCEFSLNKKLSNGKITIVDGSNLISITSIGSTWKIEATGNGHGDAKIKIEANVGTTTYSAEFTVTVH